MTGDTHRVALRVPPAALAGIRNTPPADSTPDLGGGWNAQAASDVNAVPTGGEHIAAKLGNAEPFCGRCGHAICSHSDAEWAA